MSDRNSKPGEQWPLGIVFFLRPAVSLPLTLIFILLAIPVTYRSTRLSGIPPIDEPVDRESQGRVVITDGENAFTLYRDVYSELESRRLSAPDLGEAIDALETSGWNAAAPLIESHLESRQALLERWRLGTERRRGVRVQPADLKFHDCIRFSETREIGRLVVLKAAQCLHYGKPDEAWKWSRALFRFSRHLGNPGHEVDRLLGKSLFSMATKQLVLWAADDRVDSLAIAAAQRELRTIGEMTAVNSTVVKSTYLDRMNSLESHEWTKAVCEFEGSMSNSYLFLNSEPDLCRMLLRHAYANYLSQCDLSRSRRVMAGGGLSLFRPTGKENPPLMDPAALSSAMDRSHLAQVHLMHINLLLTSSDIELAMRSTLQLCLSAELFRREQGKYPEALDDLVPRYFDEVPNDLFSADPCEQMLLRKVEESPEDDVANSRSVTRRWLVIYSRGPNGFDDGGKTVSQADVGHRIPLPGGLPDKD